MLPFAGQGAAQAIEDGLTLAAAIVPSTDRSDPFYKSGFAVRANPNRLYGQGLSRLFYYAEAYDVDALAGADETYTVYSYIAEANRAQALQELEQRVERPVRSPDVLVGSFDLTAVPSGSYFLHVAVLNENNEAVSEEAAKFFVYNPGVEREQPVFLEETFEMSEYAEMPEEQVEEMLGYARIVATDQERRRIRSMEDLDARRRFLMDFWKARDPNPATPRNEYREAFLERVEFANERYSSTLEEGWMTDRGRILVKYGQPANIDPHLYDREMLPHEIWRYNNIPGEGQAMFVFADRTGFGEFELIHATVVGERSLPNWRDELARRQ